MDEETLMLLLLAIVMLVGSYLAGNIPLVFNLSEEKLRSVTIFGAGLLVGTALTVIIPEGINALYSEGVEKITTEKKIDVTGLTSIKEEEPHVHHIHANDHSRTIGLSLVLGFIFMLLVDQISQRRTSNDKNITATIGLVVHAAADGVALGAAATTSHQDVEMIVFLAIMLHKAPAAFGLVSFLLHEGTDRQRIRRHLGIFSLSAPLFAFITYFCIGQEQKETLNSVNATGIAMLFSAGTFLYVATVHVLPELTQNAGHSHSRNTGGRSNINYDPIEKCEDGNGIAVSTNPKGYGGLKNFELIVMVFGALMPLIITFGHHH